MREIQVTSLNNGLTIVGESIPGCHSSAVGFFVRAGARDESTSESGVSHFLEHMAFKGTANRGALDISYEFGSMGAQANAHTSEENTVYYAAVLPENLGRAQALIAEMMRPALDPEEFAMEKKVILEEIALYQDRPHYYLFEKALADYLEGHSGGNSVLGSSESITALTRDQMKDYHLRRYAPGNIVLGVAGQYDWDQVVDEARKLCGAWEEQPVERDYQAIAPGKPKRVYYKRNLNQAHVMLIAPSCSAQDDARYPLSVLATMIGDSTGSRLYWELVDSGLAESAGADNDERDQHGLFFAFASTTPDMLDEVSRKMQSVLRSSGDFSDAELERAKTKLAAKLVFIGELPLGRLMAIGSDWTYHQKVYPLSELIERVRAVTRADVAQALEQYPLSEWGEYRLLPKE